MADAKKKKNQKWILHRHKFLTYLTEPFFWLFVLLKYRVAVKPYSDRKRQYLVLMNHQTSSDQFFVGLTFSKPMYYVASEDIFSNGLVSSLLKFALNPIPINKTAADLRAIINCIRVVKEGGSVVIAPEGNRTYSGRTCFIKPSIVQLARKLDLPIAFFRIDGGYGVQPRWTDKNRKGKISFGVSGVLEPEEYRNMTDDSLYREIVSRLSADEACISGTYRSKHQAEHIERLLYVCPECGFTEYESSGNEFSCKKCGLKYEYSDTKEIICRNGQSNLRFAADFCDYQENYLRNTDYTLYTDSPAFSDESCRLYSVELYKRKKLLYRDVNIKLFGDRIEFSSCVNSPDAEKRCAIVCTFENIKSISLLGRNKMNLRTSDGIIQVRGLKSFNPVKFMNFYYHYKAQISGGYNGNGNTEFLGL